MKQRLPERRRFVRVKVPLKLTIKSEGHTDEVVTSDVSPVGLRFEICRELKESDRLDMVLYLPPKTHPVHLSGEVIWKRRVSLEDNASYDVGVEIIDIAENNKNVFLKYLCDLLYDSTYEERE